MAAANKQTRILCATIQFESKQILPPFLPNRDHRHPDRTTVAAAAVAATGSQMRRPATAQGAWPPVGRAVRPARFLATCATATRVRPEPVVPAVEALSFGYAADVLLLLVVARMLSGWTGRAIAG